MTVIANAIDAHASIIEVYVDLKGYNIKVVDNGTYNNHYLCVFALFRSINFVYIYIHTA